MVMACGHSSPNLISVLSNQTAWLRFSHSDLYAADQFFILILAVVEETAERSKRLRGSERVRAVRADKGRGIRTANNLKQRQLRLGGRLHGSGWQI